MRSFRILVVALTLLAAVALVGCGAGKQPTARLQFYPPTVTPAIGLSDTVYDTTANTITVSWLVFNADPAGAVAYNVPWAVTRDGIPNTFTGTITAIPNHGWAPASFTVTEPVGVHIYQLLIDPNGTIPQSSREGSVVTLWVSVFPRRQRLIPSAMRALLDLLLPTLCPACRHADGPGLCGPCTDAIPRLDRPCPWCGTPFGMGEPQQAAPPLNAPPGLPPGRQGAVESEGNDSQSAPYSVRKVCYRCRNNGFPHVHAVAVTAAYTGVIKALVTGAKANARPAAVRALAALFAENAANLPTWPADAVITPVPPAPGRRPGPHLATALAKAFAKRTHRPLRHLLRQTRNATPQHRLAGHARHANVVGLFAATVAATAKNPAPDHVILVDDLLTSGATITAAAATLHAAGVGKIHALILARSPTRNDPPTLGAPWAGTDDEE